MYNVIVAGSTDFTRDCILQLMELDNVNLNGVIAPIDTKKDRKGNIINSPVVEIALDKKLNLFQPESINKDDFYNILSDLSPDFLIVVAYGKILNKRTLSLPKIMPLNIHGSLLPVLRGASPVEHALLYGFEKSGTTLQKMDIKLDEGDIILQHEVNIDKDWQFNDLYDKIKESGVYLLKEFFKDTDKHISNMIKQDDSLATYCSKIKKEDGKLDFSKDAVSLHNMTRAFVRWPTAYCFYKNVSIKVFNSECVCKSDNKDSDFGKIVDVNNNGIYINALNGLYVIKELQKEGKKRQTVKEFLCGNKLVVGEYFN
ncbi:methionyl-tRNA formyltransferase [Brachyspira hyodysenteriae]|nr:methionyl-tRNA formyltransferase [Brachyspira hyodysenteriae]AUJ48652.1 methionyl-tRNA formyltransferase [Brachyspira hyodysenteriae]MBT8720334.1 methionyl-tRNA formyltransferase [Brachyspira hyodysenteriae]MBT8730572.1 methionyl-tRNA formyltransferase [Brachyspira hyodysenteriae]MBT8732918.1 methionyl-tRNA formyltransferase [Brachyspira hyodysenteriae]MBT8735678.1 methionyl-tRNA formyltransferase [Brachyspira hyodysenteriae]